MTRSHSIPAAQDALRSMSSSFLTDFTEDPTAFTSDNLAGYAAVVFLSNSEGLADSDPEVLDTNEQKQALFDWLGRGGALVGLHAGCACLFKTRECTTRVSFLCYREELRGLTMPFRVDRCKHSCFWGGDGIMVRTGRTGADAQRLIKLLLQV